MPQVSHSQTIQASPDQVWAILADVTRLPDWAYTAGRFPHLVEGRYGSEQTTGAGTLWVGLSVDGQTATQQITTWEPAQTLAYTLQATENAPLQISQTNCLTLEPAGDQTHLTWQVDWALTGGFSLGSLLLRFSGNRAFEEMMVGSLEKLKQVVEKETTVPEPADSTDLSAD
jgi:uncharacterized protein YndB with AHSA1/START domain